MLTQREREVGRRLMSGATNIAIGQDLGLSEMTVKSHVRGLFEKLGVKTRTAAAVRLMSRPHLLDDPNPPDADPAGVVAALEARIAALEARVVALEASREWRAA
ncbi:MAG: response regulator transcription factor [Gemmatimonadota bacterium]